MTDTHPPSDTFLDTDSTGAAGYRVLARKYRPSTFESLIGQEVLVRTLRHAIESGRLAQAWMLTGVRGVGKTTTARLIARALNCVGPDGNGSVTIDPCGVCEHCRAIAQDRHVDVQEMDAASHTGVGDIREILESVRYRPAMARTKVYIIDEVHMLSSQAFNALLKTLEEPPPHVKFIFATTELRKVPVTVLSRCQRFDLRRVPLGLLEEHFTRIAGLEGIPVEPEAIRLIARAADGSVRDGLSLLDQAIAHAGGEVGAAMVADMLGLADRSRVLDLLEHVLSGRVPAALDELGAQYALGADPLTVLQDLLGLVHWMTRIKVAPDSLDAEAPVGDSDRERARDLASRLSMRVLNRAWQILIKGLSETREAPLPLQAVEMTLIRLGYAGDLPFPEDLLRRLQRGEIPVLPGGPADGGAGGAPSAGGGPGGSAMGHAYAAPMAVGASGPGPTMAISNGAIPQTGGAMPEAAAAFAPSPRSFVHLVELFREKRRMDLVVSLERQVQLVRFDAKARVLEFHPLEEAPRSLAGQVGELLSRWTGARWVVSVSDRPGAVPLHSERQADIHADPVVASILELFPGAEVGAVRVNLKALELEDTSSDALEATFEDNLIDPFDTEDDS
ncbi:DNA polymerase III subunit gamma/tau [Phaeovibrio sulfidiphilus]|uniref:DNA polymerase III subunit gamma/tau n=1 Tax=Phaeovibrio sulfidiphilus TaxID=1220600 RepID=A0A8J6YXM6_9PROT|nr:DNA polymerase III subunit gamma/tau [Phaeovibrio sulfidiphilus]MBE1237557.1 DNA polymerase III subunit gamma/tau [Phaeovibrio sulfidiphilus]